MWWAIVWRQQCWRERHKIWGMRVWLLLVMMPLVVAGQSAFTVKGPWEIEVNGQVVRVAPPQMKTVVAERYEQAPVFNPKAGGWVKGAQLKGVRAQETTSPKLLDRESLVLRLGPGEDGGVLKRGVDYEADLEWGTFGRIEGGGLKEGVPVYAWYRHAEMRIDAVVEVGGKVQVIEGSPRAAAPAVPQIPAGAKHLGNVYLPGYVEKLEADHLFPIFERSYPELPRVKNAVIDRIAQRLKRGEALRILAWGDSVTDGAYLASKSERWQEQFVERLRREYPQARIELVTEAWGGRNTRSYLNEPPGSAHNYREKVLGAKADVVISEFVNDAGLKPEEVEERYAKLLADFKAIGAEWIILTPHYVRPDWMNLTREREVDEDPRPYVAGLRAFAAKHDVALADASLRYGRLWRQGVPYNALMLNSINHPDARGMKLFADALLALFPKVLFRAGFETGDLSEWDHTGTRGQNIKPRNIEVVQDVVASGKHAVRVTIHGDDVFNAQQLRAQLGGPRVTVGEGSETFMKFKMYMKEAPKSRDNFFYWEGNPPPRWNNVMTWWVEPRGDGTTAIRYGTGNLGRNGTLWDGTFETGKWHELAMQIRWSEDATKGMVKLWFDGKVVLEQNVKTKGGEMVYFCQPGIQRSPHQDSVDTIYFDDFVLSEFAEDVVP